MSTRGIRCTRPVLNVAGSLAIATLSLLAPASGCGSSTAAPDGVGGNTGSGGSGTGGALTSSGGAPGSGGSSATAGTGGLTVAGTGGVGTVGGATGAVGGRAGTGGSSPGSSGGTTGGGGGGAALGCAGKTYKLCEDFEAGTVGALPAGWTSFKGYGTSRPTDQTVATDQFHSGSKALKSVSMSQGASRIQRSLTSLGATANTHWGRIFYKVQNPSAVDNAHVLHTTFVSVLGGAQENRIVDTVETQGAHTHQWLFNNPDDGGGASSAYSWTFDDAWHCAEWNIDLTTKSFRFFSDSIEVKALAFTGGNHEMPPAYMAIILGATYYQTDTLTGPFTMWIDDLAIDDTQIGCQ
jgi:hypothetical protein